MPDLRSLDATGMIKAMDAGRITAVELLEASVASARRLKDQVNAVVVERLDVARAAARAIDARRAVGETSETIGGLAGVPMTIKDTFDVEGMPASSGLAAYLERGAGDAAAVARLRREGAVIWGKTNVPVRAGDWQTFNALYGQTNNPWDAARTPGGSSGGAAAALACGITPVELGSDIGGSLRVPAHFCGVVSHKPTFGLVPQRGHVPPRPGAAAEPDLNVVGPMARSVRDLRLLLSVLTGGPIAARAPPAELPGLKVALWVEDPAFVLDGEVQEVVEAFASALEGEGALVERTPSPVPGRELLKVFADLLYPLVAFEMPPAERRALERARLPARLFGGGAAWARTARAATLSHTEWLLADEARAGFKEVMRRLFKHHDVLIAPVAPVTAFAHQKGPMSRRVLTFEDGRRVPYDALSQWIALATVCHLPATAIPAGFTASGRPCGIQIIGALGADGKTLAVAQAIEERLGGFRPPPLDLRPAVR